MSITEHIQQVADNIAAQRIELNDLQSQRKQAGIMTGVWAVFYFAMLAAGQWQQLTIVLGLIFLIYNAFRLVSLEKKCRSAFVLMSDNEHYKAIIVDEAYSGKEAYAQD